MMTTRERLEALNRDCEKLCDEHGYYQGWQGRSPAGRPNMRLLYSTPETFEAPARVMWLGKNPGGRPEDADRHPHDAPFKEGPGWSDLLDLRWGRPPFARGQHPMQRAALDAAALFAGDRSGGEALLRASPAGNLSPFRSRRWTQLPRGLRNIGIGVHLIRLAHPRVLVLMFSEAALWNQLLNALGRRTSQTKKFPIAEGAGFTLRECVGGGSPEYVLALPGVNTRTPGHNERVLRELGKRIAAHNLEAIVGGGDSR